MDDILFLLIDRAKKGCSDSFDCVFEMYKPVVYSIQKRSFLRGYESDDWLQEGRMICFQSIQSYNRKYGSTFGYYFKGNFEKHVYTLIRKQGAYKRKTDDMTVYTHNVQKLEPHFDRKNVFHTSPIEYIFVRDRMLSFASYLSPYENKIFIDYINHQDIVKSKDRNAFNRTKKKFIKHLSN